MEPSVFANATQLGLGGLIFVIWYFDSKRVMELMGVIKEQVQDKKQMGETQQQLMDIIEKQSALLTRNIIVLERLEKKLK